MTQRLVQRIAFLAAVLLLLASGSAVATVVSELPVTTVGGRQCFYYDVKPKESIYSVSNELGVTREQIVDFNPSAADGLTPRMRLYFPVEAFQVEPGERPAVYAAAAGITTHVVKDGESIYGIARQYGMSTDYLVKLNPWADEGIHEGQVLRITDKAASDVTAAQTTPVTEAAQQQKPNAAGYIRHRIEQGETLFAISNANNVPLEVVLDANPTLDPLRYTPGQTIMIPVTDEAIARHKANIEAVAAAGGVTGNAVPTAAEQPAAGQNVALLSPEAVPAGQVQHHDTLQVAVMLPFMLSEEPQSRTTQLYTEFFKGMLMAADTLRTDGRQPVNFSFYDTGASIDNVRRLVQNPRVAQSDMVIAPDNSDQIGVILEGVDSTALVLNIFAVKDDSYLDYRNAIQMNIPHDAMYDKAIGAFIEKFGDRMPVFISRISGQADKDSFVSELKLRLDSDSIAYREVTYSDVLRDEDLAELNPDETPMVFVPNSGSKNEFAKYAQALTYKRQGAINADNVKVWGYPEWVTFRGESYDAICNLGATIYSRFLVDDRAYDAKALKDRYRALYGVDMFDAVPTQGILGFDVAMFVIEGLRHKAETGSFLGEYDGVQNSFRLDSPASGLVNQLLFLIKYNPGGYVDSEKL